MYSILALFFQRMRTPLIVLISAYSIAILGFTLVPGIDEDGQAWTMNFLQALYVVSYTGSTIGFGEIPREFSSAQRMWTIASIYMTVFAWLFGIGSMIALIQDSAFRQALKQKRLERSVATLDRAFYLVCGYGDTGKALVKSLIANGRRAVVVDHDPEAIQALNLQDHGIDVPGFCSDATIPGHLIQAGLQSRWCAGLLAVTESDRTNLGIALSGRLLNRNLTVAGRANETATARNMKSFETGFVVQPDAAFAEQLTRAIAQPEHFWLHERLSGNTEPEIDRIPTGYWVLCGHNRCSRNLADRLEQAGIETRLIAHEDIDGPLPEGCVPGHSAEAGPLEAAGVGQAAGLVACHEVDSENLSTLMTARDLNPDLVLAARENHMHNRALYAEAGVIMDGTITRQVVSAFRPVLESSLAATFIDQAMKRDTDWVKSCRKKLEQAAGGHRLTWWAGRISRNRSPAIVEAIDQGQTVPIRVLLQDPNRAGHSLPCVAMMLRRDGKDRLAPDPDTPLESGDVVLFAGRRGADHLMRATAFESSILQFLITGRQQPGGWLWRKLAR